MKIMMVTALALIAFAANSVLCRLALGEHQIDAMSFTMIRLLSGAVMLYALLMLQRKQQGFCKDSEHKGSWLASLMLFVYALTFSYAYIDLDTATGALILFSSIQLTMISSTIWQGGRLQALEWLGLGLAFSGFIYLMLPEVGTPLMKPLGLMVVSGVAWSVYTFQGYASKQPLSDTTFNFLRTIPLLMLMLIFSIGEATLSMQGVWLAIASGAFASGVGYTLWYIALQGLNGIQASVLQLLVPVIAAVGGVVFVGEYISMRVLLSGFIIMVGVGLVLIVKKKIADPKAS